jgi:mRNA interferase MazF
MEIKRGDIVLMVAPRDLGRPRPGVVVQADELNADFSTIFICPMTTDIQDDFPLRPLIDPNPENGLRLRSQVMADKMAAIRRDQIRSLIGRVDAGTAEQLDRSLLVILGLARH